MPTTQYHSHFIDDILFDPHCEFDALTDEQRQEMEDEHRSLWLTEAGNLLAPHGLEILGNGDVVGEIGLNIDREEIRTILNTIDDLDPEEAFFTKWANINAAN